MRYVFAIAALVIAGVLLLLGVGQRTVFAGPAEIELPVTVSDTANYAVIDGSEFSKLDGAPNIVVRGSHAFVATGATRDVHGWVEPYLHQDITVDSNDPHAISALVAAGLDRSAEGADASPVYEPFDPRGNDLWVSEKSIDAPGNSTETDTLRVPVPIAADQSVLVATDGTSPLPEKISLVWVQDRNTPLAGPLLAAGAVFALLGGVLYLLAFDHDRRGLGPRRGKRGPLQGIRGMFSGYGKRGRTRSSDANATTPETAKRRAIRLAVPAVLLTAVLGLSGCSAEYWPQPAAPAPTDDVSQAQGTVLAPVPVTDAQIHRIVTDVAEVAKQADSQLDAKILQQRFSGDALTQRTANYKIRAAVNDYAVVPPQILSTELNYNLVQSTESWPRTMLVTVESQGADDTASPSLALLLTQDIPQHNFTVNRVIALRGGITMPSAAPAEEGTALLSNTIDTFAMRPGDVGAAFADVLQNGSDSQYADTFDVEADTMLSSYGKVRAQLRQQESDGKGETMAFSVTARQGDAPPVALSTGVGGAIVATTVIEDQIVEANGGRYKPQAAGVVTALSGLSGEQDRVVQEVAHQMLFFVPNKNDGSQIQLLGVTSELVEARN